MIAFKSNPEGCACPKRLERFEGDCVACYYSQCHEGTWHGSQACWDAQCLVVDVKRTDPLYVGAYKGTPR